MTMLKKSEQKKNGPKHFDSNRFSRTKRLYALNEMSACYLKTVCVTHFKKAYQELKPFRLQFKYVRFHSASWHEWQTDLAGTNHFSFRSI